MMSAPCKTASKVNRGDLSLPGTYDARFVYSGKLLCDLLMVLIIRVFALNHQGLVDTPGALRHEMLQPLTDGVQAILTTPGVFVLGLFRADQEAVAHMNHVAATVADIWFRPGRTLSTVATCMADETSANPFTATGTATAGPTPDTGS